jgi:hypothetical protein
VIAGFTTSENGWVLEAVAISVVVTLNEEVVGEATGPGVPLITPALLSDNPGGRAPLVKLQTNGAVPPVSVSVRAQLIPAVQACSGFVLMAGAGLIVTLKLRVALSFAESVAVTLAENVPEALGFPETPTRAPVVGLTASPPGSPAEVHE